MASNNMNALIEYAVQGGKRDAVSELERMGKRVKARRWTSEDEAFLRENLGRMTEEELARRLNRTVVAIHLRWERDMGLQAPSKADGIVTANEAAKLLNVDAHALCHWVDIGFLPARVMAGKRKIRLIDREALEKWVLVPDHWMYFDPMEVRGRELKRKIKDAMKHWGDEWWSTPKVAAYHGVTTGDVKRYIKRGVIKARQIKHSIGGRAELKWRTWFVLKSEATRKDLVFVRGRGRRRAIKPLT